MRLDGTRLLVELVHPAQYHLFKQVAADWMRAGGEVVFTARDKDVTVKLLEAAGVRYELLSAQGRGLVGLGVELLRRGHAMFRLARKVRPHVMIANTGVSICPVGRLLGIPTLLVEEAEHAHLQRALSVPFATRVITGDGYMKDLGNRQTYFRGVWVHAYLHPSRFRPDATLLRAAGIDVERPYAVVRLVSWDAAHDVAVRRDTRAAVVELLREMSERYVIYGTFEGKESSELTRLVRPFPVDLAHHLIAFAKLFIGEGATMAAEAAVLGVPAIYVGPLRWGYMLHLERLELLRICSTYAEAHQQAQLIAQDDAGWRARAASLASASDDVSGRIFEEAVALALS